MNKTHQSFCEYACDIKRKNNKQQQQNKILFGTINIYLYRFIILYCGIFIYFVYFYFHFYWLLVRYSFFYSQMVLSAQFCSETENVKLSTCELSKQKKKNLQTISFIHIFMMYIPYSEQFHIHFKKIKKAFRSHFQERGHSYHSFITCIQHIHIHTHTNKMEKIIQVITMKMTHSL